MNGQTEYKAECNSKPEIIPGIREWKGTQGLYRLGDNPVLIYSDASSARTLEIIAGQLSAVIRKTAHVECSEREHEGGGAAFILQEDKLGELGDEGYYMEIGDSIKVIAATNKGLLYGGMTFVQMLYISGGITAPKGIIKDYPQYPVRSISLDVGRFWVPMDYVKEITKYLALFKVNEIHLHISDVGGETSFLDLKYHSTLRLESKKYPEVNSIPGQFYTQEEYRSYQKEVADFGVKVVTEIDAPAHCAWVHYVNPDYMYDWHHMKLDRPEARAFMKDLLGEFLEGDDPVIVSDTFGIGCDEYSVLDAPESFTSYMNEIAQFVNALGYKAQFWSNSSTGKLPLEFDGIVNMWAYADNPNFMDSDFGLINSDGPMLYVVPGSVSNWFSDHMEVATVYDSWEANVFDSGNKNPAQVVDVSDPRLLGAEASIWYDGKVGCSEFDYFDRIFDQIMLISEKCWFGKRAEGQTGDKFLKRIEMMPELAFEANPARYVYSNGDTLVNIDFESVNGAVAYDSSENGYNAALVNAEIGSDGINRYAVLNGGYIYLPFDSVGFPYSASVDVYLDSAPSEGAALFKGKDGAMYLNLNGTGKVGYIRHGYEYIFDYTLPIGKWVRIELFCNDKDLTLVAEGMHVLSSRYTEAVRASKQFTSTFVLPTENIGEGIFGKLDNIVIKKYPANENLVEDDLALGRSARASSEESAEFGACKATDGIPTGNSRWSPSREDINAELIIDLEALKEFNKIVLKFYGAVAEYMLLASVDGADYTEFVKVVGGPTLININAVHSFKPQNARYIKFVQLVQREDSSKNKYGCSLKELEIYNSQTADYSETYKAISRADALDKNAYASFSAVDEAISAVDFGKNPHEQGIADAYARKINTAISELV